MDRLTDWWIDHPKVDLLLIPLGLSAALVPVPTGDSAVVSNFAMGVATVGGVLLGMGAVVFTIYLGATGPRFTALRAFEGVRIRSTWFGILIGYVAACVVSLVALALAGVEVASLSIAGCSAVLLATKAWRMTLVLRYIMEISDREALDAAGGPPRRSSAAI